MTTIGTPASSAVSLQSSNVSMQDFLNILMTQLTYQDPLKPMDNKEFMAQLAQFTTLGQTQQLNQNIEALLSTQASMQSVGLIGRTVSFDTGSGLQLGVVTSVSWAGTVPELTATVSGTEVTGISLSQVTQVTQVK